jgi:uncharacterized protein YndB with AHSA1/START domain
MDTIHHLVEIDAPGDKVYDALTAESGLSGWWTTKVASPDPSVGSSVKFTFEDPFHPEMEITELEPGSLVAWRGANQPWLDAQIRFELGDSQRYGDGTALRFWQRYAGDLDDDSFGIFNYNWAYYLESLRRLVTEGKGMPFAA